MPGQPRIQRCACPTCGQVVMPPLAMKVIKRKLVEVIWKTNDRDLIAELAKRMHIDLPE